MSALTMLCLTVNAFATNPNLYDFEEDGKNLLTTCQWETCTYADKKTGLKNIPLRKDWAIEKPYYSVTAGGAKSKDPTIIFVNTKSGVWIRMNLRQQSTASNFVKCEEISHANNAEDLICLLVAEIPKKEMIEGEKMMKLISAWRKK